MRTILIVAIALSFATSLWAQGAGGSTATNTSGAVKVDGGFDLRAREENLNNIPMVTGTGPGTHQDYLRIRTRVWGSLEGNDLGAYARLANEWRTYWAPSHANLKNFNWPDETLVDNLYLDVKNLFGGCVDLRIGRQDLMYGAGRVILDGTPGDGSRTLFFDAAKAVIRIDKENTLDVLGIYNNPHAGLTTGSDPNHDLTQISGKQYKGMPGNDLIESGAGLVWGNKSCKNCPIETYFFWKHESDWHTWNPTFTAYTKVRGRDVYTLGSRATPKFNDEFSGDVEAAVQYNQTRDNREFMAGMGYAGLTWQPALQSSWRPYAKLACYYLSGEGGNDPQTGKGWDPLWARYPQLSELYVLAYNGQYGVGYWSNLLFPHAEVGVNIGPMHKLFAYSGPMLAPVKDGPDDGSLRGWLTVARYEFPLLLPSADASGPFGRRLAVFGHLQAEFLTPGDYYAEKSMAYFLRWELNVKF